MHILPEVFTLAGGTVLTVNKLTNGGLIVYDNIYGKGLYKTREKGRVF